MRVPSKVKKENYKDITKTLAAKHWNRYLDNSKKTVNFSEKAMKAGINPSTAYQALYGDSRWSAKNWFFFLKQIGALKIESDEIIIKRPR